MSNEQDKKTNPNPEELQELEDNKLDKVAGGWDWDTPLKEGICPAVAQRVTEVAKRFFTQGEHRNDCGRWIQDNIYRELCQINEDNGYEYNIDWMYLNHIIDKQYGII